MKNRVYGFESPHHGSIFRLITSSCHIYIYIYIPESTFSPSQFLNFKNLRQASKLPGGHCTSVIQLSVQKKTKILNLHLIRHTVVAEGFPLASRLLKTSQTLCALFCHILLLAVMAGPSGLRCWYRRCPQVPTKIQLPSAKSLPEPGQGESGLPGVSIPHPLNWEHRRENRIRTAWHSG